MLVSAQAAPTATAEDFKIAVGPCMQARDYACAQTNWEQYLLRRPTDGNAVANLAIVMNMRDNHAAAIRHFERAMELGEGTYDLFSYYADSLAKTGRNKEAIDWSYKALAIVPRLVDVRGSLAKLLVLEKRHYEALALLEAFDEHLIASGRPPYFEGQRMAIESVLERQVPEAALPEKTGLRLPKYGDHFYAPVSLGSARPSAFVVDTGASDVVLGEDMLLASRLEYKALRTAVPVRVADGRTVHAREVLLPRLRIGPHELSNVRALVCKRCVPLLGQRALSKFDLRSSKVQGVEFLALTLRR